MEKLLGNLLSIFLTIVALVFIFSIITGKSQALEKILGGPFAAFGWMFRGIFGALGQGLKRWASDLHRECYHRWPLRTTVVEAIPIVFVVLLVLFLFSGCAGVATYSWHHTSSEGRLTPPDEKVPQQEFTLGVVEIFGGTGSITTSGTGSIRGRDPVTLRTRVRRF